MSKEREQIISYLLQECDKKDARIKELEAQLEGNQKPAKPRTVAE